MHVVQVLVVYSLGFVLNMVVDWKEGKNLFTGENTVNCDSAFNLMLNSNAFRCHLFSKCTPDVVNLTSA